jgi:hypothetical protein
MTALRRRRPPPTIPLPPTRLGYPHPRNSHGPLHHRRWQLPLGRHDTEQPQEGTQGKAEEGYIDDTFQGHWLGWAWGSIRSLDLLPMRRSLYSTTSY